LFGLGETLNAAATLRVPAGAAPANKLKLV
jgi:hypothetical protein